MTDPNQRATGVEHNGQIWDGAKWVPKPAEDRRPGDPNWGPPSGSSLPAGSPQPGSGGWSPGMPIVLGFASPYYSYGLTKRAADDIHFIARYMVIVIWVSIILVIASFVLWGFSLLAIGSIFSRIGR